MLLPCSFSSEFYINAVLYIKIEDWNVLPTDEIYEKVNLTIFLLKFLRI